MRFWLVLLTALCLTASADGTVAETIDASAFCEEAAVPVARVAPAATALVRTIRALHRTHELPAQPTGMRIFRPPRA